MGESKDFQGDSPLVHERRHAGLEARVARLEERQLVIIRGLVGAMAAVTGALVRHFGHQLDLLLQDLGKGG